MGLQGERDPILVLLRAVPYEEVATRFPSDGQILLWFTLAIILARCVCAFVADVAVIVADHRNYCSRPSSRSQLKWVLQMSFLNWWLLGLLQ